MTIEGIKRKIERDLKILAAYKEVHDFVLVGKEFGFTGERIRQIVATFGYKKPRKKALTFEEKEARKLRKILKRFWAKVKIKSASQCWEWQACRYPTRYGKVSFKGKADYAHRIIFEILNNRKPEGLILHSCDNPPCVNPNHLREGTAKDNCADREVRGRSAYQCDYEGWMRKMREGRRLSGKANKISEKQICEVRKRYANGEKVAMLAINFDCHTSTIYRTIRNINHSDSITEETQHF